MALEIGHGGDFLAPVSVSLRDSFVTAAAHFHSGTRGYVLEAVRQPFQEHLIR